MDITFDPAKDAINVRKHGLSLNRAEDFDFNSAFLTPDDSRDYEEQRYRAIGFLDARLFALMFTDSEGAAMRVISLRRASEREAKEYVAS